jgi:23S rRNA-/tRNA-specific pseudouridylate synthase
VLDVAVAWVRKTYWAVVETSGDLAREGTIDEPVKKMKDEGARSQPALTHYSTLAQSRGLAWLELYPITGEHPIADR